MHKFLKFILEWNSTCFRQFLCPSSGIFHCTHSNGICHTGLLTACEQACRVSFQNKFEKLVHLVGFIKRNCHNTRSHDHLAQFERSDFTQQYGSVITRTKRYCWMNCSSFNSSNDTQCGLLGHGRTKTDRWEHTLLD